MIAVGDGFYTAISKSAARDYEYLHVRWSWAGVYIYSSRAEAVTRYATTRERNQVGEIWN